MKKYILTLLLTLTLFCANSSNLISNNALDYEYSYFTNICSEWLNIDSIEINIINTKLPVQGFVHIIDSATYVILINQKYCDNIYITIAHELTHIKQNLDGIKIIESGNYSFKDNKYINDEAIKIEKETVILSERLYYRYLKYKEIIYK